VTIKVAILDFDGTLVESNDIKDSAFEALYSELPQWAEIRDYHLANNHTIRFEKFRAIDEDILDVPHTAERARDLAVRFQDLVVQAIASAPWVTGATELLDALDAAGVHAYLLSMSPAEELARILEMRGVGGRFAAVYAHPWSKGEAVCDILARENASPSEAVMIGDSPEDASVAGECGVRFVGRDSGKPFASDVEAYPDLLGVISTLDLDAEASDG